MQITTRLEFDAGHRIPSHKSQCKNLHGHRYAIEITLSGDIISQEGTSENGMVMDFSDVKKIAKTSVVDVWDHAFLVYQHDLEILNFLNTLTNHKTVIFPTVPTAENMAAEAFKILKTQYQDTYGNHLKLEKVRLYETPNNWADALG
ncbi:6-carboxytetrahydropterin synthase QueD [Methylotenera sp.]|uniref:6-carboxytetrahydropterin synthase QueD n=1 Tax=Methylotenera sp. TaxID=2051956 RepID=UPI002721C133|nr:6-carboxytetrahydropterin synthase QueD [Methylotenera sp.]MDO9204467.1 6-carboxytetrahydropterin synthase QueD [Methylotenera sp.]MDP2072148.1 6-carboxytetrahydropterin synthase QueD [Methylotenera sp.]MDP3006841.1 6-carboxytetrahydropterin synthase QueD [Methylotenera sp.]MDP3007222.1 6-carboxytetrahydropterin synthase QueD [Methylotenera sp.]MDP3307750.1 6-carboxytetrahydropterin synthase QueD [Methylotenera sp.]